MADRSSKPSALPGTGYIYHHEMAAYKGNNMLSADKYLHVDGFVGGAIILSLALLFLVVQETREIFFYKRNNWNFDLDSNIGTKMYRGESIDEKDLVTNKSRVLYGRPFLIVLFLGVLIALLAILLSK